MSLSAKVMDRLANLEKKSALFWMATGCLVVSGVGVGDVVTGSEISFSLFYLIPIALVAWLSSRKAALTTSVISAIVWFIADDLAGQTYSQPVIRYWNAAVRLGFFVAVSLLLPALKSLEREKTVARTDDLTGTSNRRHVFEMVQAELNRSQRYRRPLTIAYVDLDDFKAVNDQLGHQTGDRLLCAVANQARKYFRKTDFLGRLGGDEFILLLPETGQDAAQVTVSKIQSGLLHEMRQNDWSVTFSIGALTYLDGSITGHELIRRADNLMYSVKRTGKNAIAYGVYAG